MASRKTIDSLISLTIPEIQSIFLEQMQDVVDRALLDEMVKAIELGDAEMLFRATGFTPAVLSPILDRIELLYKEAAEITAEGFPSRIQTPRGSVIFRFNFRNPSVEKEIREHSSNLVTRITEETKQVLRIAIERGVISGSNPRTTALDIVGRVDPTTKKRTGGLIGLTPHQERWVDNMSRYLNTADESYFNLSLRDKRFDKTVQKYMSAGQPVPKEILSKLTTSYKNQVLQYRARVIARTETLSSVQRASFQTHKQLVDDGVVNAAAIKKWWNAVGDRRTRPSHNIIERQSRENPLELDDPFVSPSGSRLMHPGDTSLGATAQETAQCRCRIEYEVDWFYDLDD